MSRPFGGLLLTAALLGGAVAHSVASPPQARAAGTTASKAPPCAARVSNARPLQHTTTYVRAVSWGSSRIETDAYYKSGKVVRRGITNSRSGRLTIPYAVGNAPVGWTIHIVVWAKKNGRQSHCYTSFTPTSPSPSAWCDATARSANDGYPGDYDVYVNSNQPYREATAKDSTDTWYDETSGGGSATVRMWQQYPGEQVTVTVGKATCYTTI